VVWEFTEPITLYEFSGSKEALSDRLVTHGRLTFGPRAQYQRFLRCIVQKTGRRYPWIIHSVEWPGDGWMLVVRGLHPLPMRKRIKQGLFCTIDKGDEPTILTPEDFEVWLDGERLEILVDFREAAIAEGWRPPYHGSTRTLPTLPPDHLAHWYPERTVLTCSPTREEWAENRLCHYLEWGDAEGGSYRYVEVSQEVSAYLNPQELAALIASLKQQRDERVRKEKEAKQKYPHLFQQKGETESAWMKRCYSLSNADQELHYELLAFSYRRKQIDQAIKHLLQDEIPRYIEEGGHLAEIKMIQDRQDEAEKRKEERLRAKAAIDFPVDDAAWEQELEMRQQKECERQARLAQRK
jgi:hypothetical protein